MLLGFRNDLIRFLEDNMGSCLWKEMGFDCLGCGMQRSIILLLKGEFLASFYMYPPLFTLLIMFLFLLIHLKYTIKNGHKILIFLFVLNILITLVNYYTKSTN